MRGRLLVRELEPVLEQAVQYAEECGVKARPVVKIGRRVSHSLVQTAREEECNFLIIGQPKRQSFFERIVATIVERVLEDAPCRVGVVYGTLRRGSVRGIALPVTRGMNSKLAASLAPAYAEWFGAKTRPVTIVEKEMSAPDAEKLAAEAEMTLKDAGLEESLEVLRRRDVGQGLSSTVRRGELVLIGAPSYGPVAPLLGETIPSLVAQQDKSPVMVVRDVQERRARRFERVFFSSRK
jgi:nucleotide-binding universal stress UspA family protein